MSNARLKRFGTLEFYYAVLRRDWRKKAIVWESFLKIIAILVVSIDRFIKDAGAVSAAALTFYSVLSFIPFVALALGIAKGFGLGTVLESQLHEQTLANTQIVDFVLNFANHALENMKGGLVTGLGIVFLLWAVVKVLGNTELAMNRIWGVRKGRGVTRKFTDYLSIMFIAPILVILISSINVFMTSNLQAIAMEEGFLSYAGSLMIFLLKLLPYLLVWLLFIFLYRFMPTTPVKLKHAVVAGIIAGTVYQIVQWFYIRFQIGVSSYNAIYGSLAALPLLLVWLQLSWSIVLWGTELCYILRNRHFLYRTPVERENKWIENIELSVNILKYIADEYLKNNGGPSLEMISKKLRINMNKVRVVLQDMVDKGILAQVEEDDDIFYLPLMDLHKLSLADVIIRLSYIRNHAEEKWERRFIQAINREFGDEKFA